MLNLEYLTNAEGNKIAVVIPIDIWRKLLPTEDTSEVELTEAMDRIETYRNMIRNALKSYLDISYANANIRNRAAFDSESDQYLIISEGWAEKKHLHSCLIHIEIINGKVWIQCDNTEYGVANELMQSGIPKEDIVLGFHEPNVRQYTGFAVA
jgi:hypothetical protein|nr:XisI protein [Cuspidothrix issatschenkoi]